MTAETDLLPLYAELQGHPKIEIIKHYARANVEHHTAPLQAETEALRAEVERWKSLHATAYDAFRTGVATERRLEARAERLAEALRECIDNREGLAYESEILDRARALLRDQEEGSGAFWGQSPKVGGPDWTGYGG